MSDLSVLSKIEETKILVDGLVALKKSVENENETKCEERKDRLISLTHQMVNILFEQQNSLTGRSDQMLFEFNLQLDSNLQDIQNSLTTLEALENKLPSCSNKYFIEHCIDGLLKEINIKSNDFKLNCESFDFFSNSVDLNKSEFMVNNIYTNYLYLADF